MTKLDDIALSIELVLISIIQGVALIKLAENAVPLLHDAHALQYLPYILAGLLILLVFWAQAILHAISFIRWPLNMAHMFLYFIAGFLEVMAYSNIASLQQWFFWWSIFSIVTLFTYWVDLRIIRGARRGHFADFSDGPRYIEEVERRHLQEFKFLVPVALFFNLAAFALAYFLPTLFDNAMDYALLGALQFIITLGALVDCMRNFKKRSYALAAVMRE